MKDKIEKTENKYKLTFDMLKLVRRKFVREETISTIKEIAADYVKRINNRG